MNDCHKPGPIERHCQMCYRPGTFETEPMLRQYNAVVHLCPHDNFDMIAAKTQFAFACGLQGCTNRIHHDWDILLNHITDPMVRSTERAQPMFVSSVFRFDDEQKGGILKLNWLSRL